MQLIERFVREQDPEWVISRWKEMNEERLVEREKKIKADREAIETLVREKSKGFPWLAKAFADPMCKFLTERASFSIFHRKIPPQNQRRLPCCWKTS